MQTLKASEFKARCLKLMDEVQKTGEEIVITKNGKPVSKLVPFRVIAPSLFGLHKNISCYKLCFIIRWSCAAVRFMG